METLPICGLSLMKEGAQNGLLFYLRNGLIYFRHLLRKNETILSTIFNYFVTTVEFDSMSSKSLFFHSTTAYCLVCP